MYWGAIESKKRKELKEIEYSLNQAWVSQTTLRLFKKKGASQTGGYVSAGGYTAGLCGFALAFILLISGAKILTFSCGRIRSILFFLPLTFSPQTFYLWQALWRHWLDLGVWESANAEMGKTKTKTKSAPASLESRDGGICHFTANCLERKETGVGPADSWNCHRWEAAWNGRTLCSSQSGTLAKITEAWGRSCSNQKQQRGSFGNFKATSESEEQKVDQPWLLEPVFVS